jgi:hypothetical protein
VTRKNQILQKDKNHPLLDPLDGKSFRQAKGSARVSPKKRYEPVASADL